jgi:hypothetical protein
MATDGGRTCIFLFYLYGTTSYLQVRALRADRSLLPRPAPWTLEAVEPSHRQPGPGPRTGRTTPSSSVALERIRPSVHPGRVQCTGCCRPPDAWLANGDPIPTLLQQLRSPADSIGRLCSALCTVRMQAMGQQHPAASNSHITSNNSNSNNRTKVF